MGDRLTRKGPASGAQEGAPLVLAYGSARRLVDSGQMVLRAPRGAAGVLAPNSIGVNRTGRCRRLRRGRRPRRGCGPPDPLANAGVSSQADDFPRVGPGAAAPDHDHPTPRVVPVSRRGAQRPPRRRRRATELGFQPPCPGVRSGVQFAHIRSARTLAGPRPAQW